MTSKGTFWSNDSAVSHGFHLLPSGKPSTTELHSQPERMYNYCLFVYVDVHMGGCFGRGSYAHPCTCGGQRWMPGAFLNHSIFFSKDRVSLCLEFIASARLASQGSSCLCFLKLGLHGGVTSPGFSHRCYGYELRFLRMYRKTCPQPPWKNIPVGSLPHRLQGDFFQGGASYVKWRCVEKKEVSGAVQTLGQWQPDQEAVMFAWGCPSPHRTAYPPQCYLTGIHLPASPFSSVSKAGRFLTTQCKGLKSKTKPVGLTHKQIFTLCVWLMP